MAAIDDTTVRIRDFVTQNFPLARRGEIGLHDSLLDDGIIDSMGTLEVVEFLEREFEIEVSDDEMVDDHFESIAKIAELVVSKVSGDTTTQ